MKKLFILVLFCFLLISCSEDRPKMKEKFENKIVILYDENGFRYQVRHTDGRSYLIYPVEEINLQCRVICQTEDTK